MNTERLEALAKIIEKSYYEFNGFRTGFNMQMFFDHKELKYGSQVFDDLSSSRPDLAEYNCNTTACIAGFACLAFDLENVKEAFADRLLDIGSNRKFGESPYLDNMLDKAQKVLDLPNEIAQGLFFGVLDKHVTGPQAARVIRHLIKTGEVDWFKRFEDEEALALND